MKIELQITGTNLDANHSGDWDFSIIRDGIPVSGCSAETLGEALVLVVAAANAVGVKVGDWHGDEPTTAKEGYAARIH